jgi:uncharacterized RDD family membrane protein YckC
MTCPVCKRELAPTLSICLTCGAMMHDTVREELETKVGKLPAEAAAARPAQRSSQVEFKPAAIEIRNSEPVVAQAAAPVPTPPAVRPKAITAELKKKETSPTLVDFQHKSPAVPDWRLQLQNSIRKRSTSGPSSTDPGLPTAQPAGGAVAAATAIPASASRATEVRNEKVANALKRIEESRRVYSAHGMAVSAARQASPKPTPVNRSFPFDVVERAPALPKHELSKTPAVENARPKLVSSLRIEKKKFDTNKLPPIPEPDAPLPAEIQPRSPSPVKNVEPPVHFDRLSIRNELERVETTESSEPEYDEIDDLAPLSMRFGAAVFDLIIGGFAAGIILSPFLVSNADLTSVSGFLAIGGAVLLVMFIYQTATTAFIGRTFGMKLFSLEIVDAEKNESPTLHQAAVNSAVYLLSLLLCGIGFLPAFFNEERRTVHDILSGTLLIREY